MVLGSLRMTPTINIHKIWSRVAGEWLKLFSGNRGSSLVGFKTPKSQLCVVHRNRKTQGCSSFRQNVSAKIHQPIQLTAISVDHYPILKPKEQIATDEHRCIKTHQIWSKDARGGLWQPSGIPESSLVGFKSPESIFVPYLKPKAQSATNEHRWIKNHRSKDAAEGLWQPSGIPRTSLKT